MQNYYKYGIAPKELKEIRALILKDAKIVRKQELNVSFNWIYEDVPNKIKNMTLKIYLDAVKDMMLAYINENGQVLNWNGEIFSKYRIGDIRAQSTEQVARDWMDGRGLFTPHCNGQHFDRNFKNFGDWPDLDWRDENLWFHEDRLDDPAWFKQCVLGSIGCGGHPCETIAGSLYPCWCDNDEWVLIFGPFARCSYYMLKGYHNMKKQGWPVFILGAEEYLTPKQRESLEHK